MNIVISNAIPQNANLLTDIAFQSKAHWGYSNEFMNNCRDELKVTANKIMNPKFHYYVAKNSKKWLGFYALEKIEESKIELEALFVYPKFIGQGVGRTLITHAKNTAHKLGADSMVIHGDPNAEKFYLAAGAIQIGTKESNSIRGRQLPVFEILCNASN